MVDAPPSEAVPALTKALGDSIEQVRIAAAYSVGRYGAAAVPAVSALRLLLRDEHFGLRTAAVMALGEIGPAARSAAPDLQRLRLDPDSTTRRLAGEALFRIIGIGGVR